MKKQFRSFRDINELIKDMLELKERHSAVETELKEMRERYSQLSLQFAEVEGFSFWDIGNYYGVQLLDASVTKYQDYDGDIKICSEQGKGIAS
ncbi:hypothetical protein Ahy_B01g053851 [Arachis hypogaea]|uniref:Uncharacterized protein n=1 Tax=Arachis hypogaea TaxID=3818 RepID=A0A445ASQ1_ARAHY|nr:hypothetical protein Ahy_B01g053851 [Arachis hypogaea]